VAGLWRDLRVSFRGLRRRPGFTAAVILTLSLGIGGNTALFTLLDSLFLNPLPGIDLDQHHALYRTDRQPSGAYSGKRTFSYVDFRDLRERTRAFSELAIFQWMPMNLSTGEYAERIQGAFISENYFKALGIAPFRGRFPTPAEAEPDGPYQVVVLSHSLWHSLFAGDEGALGQSVLVNGHPFEVIGIAPPGFEGTEVMTHVDLWVPITSFPYITTLAEYFPLRGISYFRVFGKRAAGVSEAEAVAEMSSLAQQLAVEYPEDDGDRGILLTSLREAALHPRERDKYVSYARFLIFVVAAILIVGAINVANLLLVRGIDLQGELALRQAVGSSRGALVWRLLAEFGLLFVLGGLFSLPCGYASMKLLWHLRPPELARSSIRLTLDGQVLLFAFGVTVLTVFLCGLVPVLRSSRPDLLIPLKMTRSSSPVSGGSRPWGRGLLVVGQLVMALVALIIAGHFITNLANARRIPLGFGFENMVVMSMAPGDQGYDEARSVEIFDNLLATVRALPGVEAAAFSENRLLRGAVFSNPVFREGETEAVEGFGRPVHRTNIVTPGFFETAGIPILDGRDFSDGDCHDCPPVAVINRAMAEVTWPGEDAVGKRFSMAPAGKEGSQELLTVVGVVEDAKYRYISEERQFFLYLPLKQYSTPSMTLHVRTAGPARDSVQMLTRAVRGAAPDLPLADVDTMAQFVNNALWLERSGAFLVSLFALLALVLAVLGVYSLMAFSVRQRQQEIGIRLALGARRGQVFWMILKEAAIMTGVAAIVGVGVAVFALGPIFSSQFQGRSIGLSHSVMEALLLALAALAGSFTPARRAARLPPAESLREA